MITRTICFMLGIGLWLLVLAWVVLDWRAGLRH